MRAGFRAAASVFLLAAALACRRGAGVLAVVGGREVTVADLRLVVSAETGRPLESVSPELAAALLESHLENEVVLAASPLASDRELAGSERTARVRELLSSLCSLPPAPSEAEIDAFLAAQGGEENHGERLLLRQLILAEEASARAAAQRARQGEDFTALSRELSRAPNAATGGAIGWVERGQLPPEFEAVIFGLPLGGTSAPVASSAGWHVFKVIERSAPGASTHSRQAARTELAARSAESARRKCLRELAGRVGVEVFPAGAPFPVHNPFEEKP
ncbi:MAG: peptidylprolyl isomerase [Acidobacteriota bacterium]